jgi:hypothetical protein
MNGSNRPLICAIRGPVTMVTVGVLFALNNFTPYGFGQTWPVLLIVLGLLSLLRRGAVRETAGPPTSDSPAFQPYSYPPPGAGSYRDSPYPPPYTPPPPPRGGFGTSAAPKPGEPQTPPPGESL